MKPYTAVQLNVEVTDTTADQIKRLAAFNQIAIAEQLHSKSSRTPSAKAVRPPPPDTSWKKKNYTRQVDAYFNFVGRV